jgi:hypothetical protein
MPYKNKKLQKLSNLNWRQNLGFFRKRAMSFCSHNYIPCDRKMFARELMLIWYKQKGRCVYTGAKLDRGKKTHIDHKIPISKGGTNDISNLQFVCDWINLTKNNTNHDEFITRCKMVSSYWL